jgi:hypothetical protein
MNKKFIWISAIILIVLSMKVLAIGITPGTNTLDFTPNQEQEFSFRVLNNDGKDMRVLIYVQGELNNSVVLYNSIVEFKSSESEKEFKYKIKMPSKIEEPGKHEVDVIIMELPSNVNGDTFIGATTAVMLRVFVNVPYPGKYAKATLDVSEAQVNENVVFVVNVFNWGVENIEKAKATIEILGPTNEVIKTIETDYKGIASKEKKELIANWKADVNPGKYYAKVMVDYDGKLTNTEKIFNVGNLYIDVKDIKVNNFNLGGIAKFETIVESKWNERIDDVYGEMIITNDKGDEIANVKSASLSVEALKEANLESYWDTKGVKEGLYNAKLILHYSGKTTEKQLKTEIGLNSLKVYGLSGTAEAVASPSGLGKGSLITLLIIILIAINVGWFIYFKKKGKGQVISDSDIKNFKKE